MPLFFFHFVGGENEGRDELGCEFETIELAYVDAYQSMVRIGAELLLEQKDPSMQRIDISDENGTMLMSIAFDEVFQRRTRRAPPDSNRIALAAQIDRSRRLGREIRDFCDQARATVKAARATLGRAEVAHLRVDQGP